MGKQNRKSLEKKGLVSGEGDVVEREHWRWKSA
jgi:hypothetical protein